MKVKTYRAPTVQQALQQVKADLGEDAMIIHSYRTRADGISGLLGRQWVEVAAAVEEPRPSRYGTTLTADRRYDLRTRNGVSSTRTGRVSPNGTSVRSSSVSAPSGVEPAGPPIGVLGDLRELRSLIAELRESVDRLQVYPTAGRRKPPTRAVAELAQQLRNQGLSTESIDNILELLERELSSSALADASTVRRTVHSIVSDWVQAIPARLSPIAPEIPPGGTRVLFLIGPTGVGKTTTIAKLAALATVGTRRRVTLVTMDNYRIGAVDQLRKYANLLRLPIVQAHTPQDLADAIAEAPDLVLVDTPGCSQYDGIHLAELREFLATAPGRAVYLVANAGATTRGLIDTADRFAPFDAVIVSKVDEAPGIGPAIDVLRACRKPVAYVTTGPQVPDDLEPGSADGLIRRLLGD